jgi:hypothetical protein
MTVPRGLAVISPVIGGARKDVNSVFPPPALRRQALNQLLCSGVTGIIRLAIPGI